MSIPRGDITTVLDRADRDFQDQYFFPIESDQSWFTRNTNRRITPAVPLIQEFTPTGPVAFGQTFSFEIGKRAAGDLLQSVMLQMNLNHWLDPQTIIDLQSGKTIYNNPADAWYYANSLGTILFEWAELQVEGVTIERVTGDFAHVFATLFPDANTQVGLNHDLIYKYPIDKLLDWPMQRPYPTESGFITCLFPFFFSRTRVRQAFPLISCKEGSVRIMIKLRPFEEVIRSANKMRMACDSTPLAQTFNLINYASPQDTPFTQTSVKTIPPLSLISLLTYSVILDGQVRQSLLRKPFEIMYREVQQFNFREPISYKSIKLSDSINQFQIDLEANHPLEEIIWFIRRKDVLKNNEWTNYSSTIESEYDPIYRPKKSLLEHAKLYINGIEIISAEGDYFRQDIAKKHKGGITAYNSFIYGYTIARFPGSHQPSGTLNASRMNSLRLVCDVKNMDVEIKVFCIGLNWLRFENGIANRLFDD